MSIPDELIEEYLRLYTNISLEEIAALLKMLKHDPREVKARLATALVARYHGDAIAAAEREWFDNTISAGLPPEDLPTLTLGDDRMNTLDLVAAARPDKSRSDSRRLIRQGGVTLNNRRLDDPDRDVLLRSNDLLKLGKRVWFRLEIAELPSLSSSGFVMRPMKMRDLDTIARYIKSWGIARYLDKANKGRTPPAQEVFRKILLAAMPRDEWLWTIADKKNPDVIIGVAHLRRDASFGNQNVWMTPDMAGAEGILPEIVAAISDYAFEALGFRSMTFQEAFEFATAPKDGDALHRAFMAMRHDRLSRDLPDGTWGFTREGWDKMQEWRRHTSPSLFVAEEQSRTRPRRAKPKQTEPPKPDKLN